MEQFFQRFGWALQFGIIAVAMLLLALMVNGVIALNLAPLTVPELPSFEPREGAEEMDHAFEEEREHWVDALTARCLFGCPEEEAEEVDACGGCPDDSFCDEETGECISEDVEEDEAMADIPRLTELGFKLTGVMAAQNPRWSMAMILHEEERETHVVGVGDSLPADDTVEILEIRRDRVFIDHGGQLEFIRLEDSPYGDPTAEDPRQQRRSSDERDANGDSRERTIQERRQLARERREEQRAQREEENSNSNGEEEERSGVVQRGDNQFTVERGRLDREMENVENLSEQARIMPNYRDGEAEGLRLVGVRSGSLYSDLGIRSGDVLHSIDGQPLTSQEQALEILESMRNEGSATLEVERRGERQEMEYRVR